jgi:hypothetical protein
MPAGEQSKSERRALNNGATLPVQGRCGMAYSLDELFRSTAARGAMAVAFVLLWVSGTPTAAQPPPPGQFDVRVITRDIAFPNIELGGRVWAGNPPNIGQMVAAEHTFRVPAGEVDFYFAEPTAVSPAGCIYSPDVGMQRVTVNGDKILPAFFHCPEDNSGPCVKGPDSMPLLAQLVSDRYSKYQAALQSYGGKDFRTTQARHEYICYQREQSTRLKQQRR